MLLALTLVSLALAASNTTEGGPYSTCEPAFTDKVWVEAIIKQNRILTVHQFDDLGDKPYVSSSEIDSYNGVTYQGFVVIVSPNISKRQHQSHTDIPIDTIISRDRQRLDTRVTQECRSHQR